MILKNALEVIILLRLLKKLFCFVIHTYINLKLFEQAFTNSNVYFN